MISASAVSTLFFAVNLSSSFSIHPVAHRLAGVPESICASAT